MLFLIKYMNMDSCFFFYHSKSSVIHYGWFILQVEDHLGPLVDMPFIIIVKIDFFFLFTLLFTFIGILIRLHFISFVIIEINSGYVSYNSL